MIAPEQELLEPCPWCGRQPKIQHMTQGPEQVHWWHVECTAQPSQRYRDATLCWGVSGPRKAAEAEAIKAWNTRTSPPMPAGVTEGVIQADRDAAADLFAVLHDVWPGYSACAATRAGCDDEREIVQAFAAHRLAHAGPGMGWRGIEEAARALVVKLDECEPAIDNGIFFAYTRMGLTYKGPTYGEELDALKAILSPSGDDGGGRVALGSQS